MVFIVSIDVPPPRLIDAGVKPALVTPFGNPDSLLTLRLTVPLNPLLGVTVTVKVPDCPGVSACAGGLAAISKSGNEGRTVIVRVGGDGSELPLPSITVRDVT